MGGVLPYKWGLLKYKRETSCTGWVFLNIAHGKHEVKIVRSTIGILMISPTSATPSTCSSEGSLPFCVSDDAVESKESREKQARKLWGRSGLRFPAVMVHKQCDRKFSTLVALPWNIGFKYLKNECRQCITLIYCKNAPAEVIMPSLHSPGPPLP